jgi:hypothetical protein
MCTLSVVTHESGYYLAMNRDERLARGAATPPEITERAGSRAIYPRDPAGGTWIAANDRGIALALLNWNDVGQPGVEPATTRSRGHVIPSLIRERSLHDVQATFADQDLDVILPFRLVGVFPEQQEIWEWRWNLTQLESRSCGWETGNWFSSSLSDGRAQFLRGQVCRAAWEDAGAGSLPWLRKLHASHADGPGPFSLCVHREAVRTLSYTELTCTPDTVRCGYLSGSPCSMQRLERPLEIERAKSEGTRRLECQTAVT